MHRKLTIWEEHLFSPPCQPLPLERAAEQSEAGPTRAFAEIRFSLYRHPERSPRSFLHGGIHHTGALRKRRLSDAFLCFLARRLSVCQEDFSTSLEMTIHRKQHSPISDGKRVIRVKRLPLIPSHYSLVTKIPNKKGNRAGDFLFLQSIEKTISRKPITPAC